MYRVLCRELIVSLGTLALLALSGAALAHIFGPPIVPNWATLPAALLHDSNGLGQRTTALGTLARLGCNVVLALFAGLVTLRILVAGLLLLHLDYAPLVHLAVALRLPVVRRAGATAAVSLLLAPAGAIARGSSSPTPPIPPVHLVTTRRGDRSASIVTGRYDRPVGKPKTQMAPKRVTLRVGMALRYTVQPGDTLSLVAERLCGDAARYGAIVRATRLLRQPDGRYLTNPNLIYPGWTLLVPLRLVTALSVSGDQAVYVVQPGDALATIAARFLGDWRRYPELRPEGTTIADPNLIHPGLVLRLPASAVVAPYSLPARPHRIKPSPLASRQPQGRVIPPAPAVAPHIVGKAPDQTTQPAEFYERREVVPRGVSMPAAPREPEGGRHAGQRSSRGHPHVRPKLHVHPVRHHIRQPEPIRRPLAASTAHAPAPTTSVRPSATSTSLTSCPPIAGVPNRRSAPTGPAVPPPVRLPGLGRTFPLPLLLALIPLFVLVARKRRHVATAATAADAALASAGKRHATSIQRAIVAVREGVRGRLSQAVAAAQAVEDVSLIVPLVRGLDDAAKACNMGGRLSAAICTVVETAGDVQLTMEAGRLSDDALTGVAAALGTAIDSKVAISRLADSTGSAFAQMTLRRAEVLAHLRNTISDTPAAHPAPLLVPIGETDSGTVLHINLARLGPILNVGGASGAHTHLATLLATVVAQADPAQLRLLVSSADDELRAMLPVLEHLEAPPADACDVSAAAAVVAQAHRVVLERFAARDSGTAEPAYLIVLDAIEELCADPRALDRLDVVCRNGRVCGVHIVAATSDVGALSQGNLLETFATRLARPLAPEESRMLFEDESAATLAPGEMAMRIAPECKAFHISPYTLTLPEVREVIAHVAVAHEAASEDETSALQNAAPEILDDADSTPAPTAMSTQPPLSEDAPDSTIEDSSAEQEMAPTPANAALVERQPTATSSPLHDKADEHEAAQGSPKEPPALVPETDAPPVELRVFGGVTILAQGAPLALKPREQRLLVALALMGPAPVRADRLVEDLFPDDDALSGQDKLQHAVTAIRLAVKKAGLPVKRAGVVHHTNGGYILDPSLVQVDAFRFRELVRRGDTADNAERGRLLAQAIDLYIGDLCGDQTLDWIEPYRQAWRKEYLAALYELALYHEQVGQDPLGALRVARRLASEEPLQDHYHQMVLELIAATGDLDALEQHFEEMREGYARYQTEIDPYTQALYERLCHRVERRQEALDETDVQAG